MKFNKLPIFGIIFLLVGCDNYNFPFIKSGKDLYIVCKGQKNWYGKDYSQLNRNLDGEVETTYHFLSTGKEKTYGQESWLVKVDGDKYQYKTEIQPIGKTDPETIIKVSSDLLSIDDYHVREKENTRTVIEINRLSGSWSYDQETRPNDSMTFTQKVVGKGRCEKSSDKKI